MKSSAFIPVRVLIADDEKAFSTMLAEMVRACGHEVVEVVHSGLDAIRSYRRHKPDIVLMDFAMAKLNGLTACRNILSDDPSGCILFLSGMSQHRELVPASSGAFAVLQKPIGFDLLKSALTDAASQRQTGLLTKRDENLRASS
jgi:two-component system chemotaxis response regulator CheB